MSNCYLCNKPIPNERIFSNQNHHFCSEECLKKSWVTSNSYKVQIQPKDIYKSILSKIQVIFDQEKITNNSFLRFRDIISDPQSPFKIIVFGKYNHGKSTFLNAWLKKNIFKTGDTRETTKIQSYNDDENNIIWTDTPGLSATEKDDKISFNAIKEADIILLIHDALAGELDIQELNFIKNSSTITKKKIKILLTKIDQNENNVSIIHSLIKNQVDIFNIEIFPISPIRYQKYVANHSAIWKEKSGFDRLEIEIKKSISERDQSRKQEVNKLYSDLMDDINRIKNKTENDIKIITEKMKTKQDQFNSDLQNILRLIN